MFRSVEIDGYRGLGRFAMRGLGRVNLLVGKNNCGKTSVLEAVYLLGTGAVPSAIWRVCDLRGERFPDIPGGSTRMEADVSHLFAGHEIGDGSRISITGAGIEHSTEFSVEIEERVRNEEETDAQELADGPSKSSGSTYIGIRSRGKAWKSGGVRFPLSPRRGLDRDFANGFDDRPTRRAAAGPSGVHFVPARSLAGATLLDYWNRLLHDGQEQRAVEALRIVEPAIQNIAAAIGEGAGSAQASFIVKLQGQTRRVPLGSLGGGVQRMLALSVVLPHCANGMLIIDEIDTGLHHTVMADMWRLIFEASKRFNVQVFASTHSYDCVESLAAICRAEETNDNEVSIQRIEAGRPTSISYSEDEIRVAAERHIETR
jgi:hypothetical protein